MFLLFNFFFAVTIAENVHKMIIVRFQHGVDLRMDLITLISRMSPSPILGVLGGIFHFSQVFIKHPAGKQWRP